MKTAALNPTQRIAKKLPPSFFGGMQYSPGASSLNSKGGRYVAPSSTPYVPPLKLAPPPPNKMKSAEFDECMKILREPWAPRPDSAYDEAVERVRKLIASIALRFPFPLEILDPRTDPFGMNWITVSMRMHVRERDGVDKVYVHGHVTVHPADSDDAILRKIRAELHMLVTHEVDECFLFNGARIFDPHGPPRAVVHVVNNGPQYSGTVQF